MHAFCLRINACKDSDAVVKLLSPECVCEAYAYGVKKNRKAFPTSLNYFALYDCDISPGKGELMRLKSASCLADYPFVAENLDSLNVAACALSFLDAMLCADDNPKNEFFVLLDFFEALRLCDAQLPLCVLALRAIELKILHLSGQRASALHCNACGAKFDTSPFYDRDALFFCRNCAARRGDDAPLKNVPLPLCIGYEKLTFVDTVDTVRNAKEKYLENPDALLRFLRNIAPLSKATLYSKFHFEYNKSYRMLSDSCGAWAGFNE